MSLKNNLVARGSTYANNLVTSRRGYLAENWVADTYNIDAVIKRISDRAIVPASTQKDSPDIIYDYGKRQASLKYYRNPVASANAQSNPAYGNQDRIVPVDQEEEAKAALRAMAEKNRMKGRQNAADIQQTTIEKIESVIRGSEGAESIPLSKRDADELAKAFKRDKNGKLVVDRAQIEKIFAKG